MHYRNGREAKNGDQIVQLGAEGRITAVGELRDAVPGNDYCNGDIYTSLNGATPAKATHACLCDCLHVGRRRGGPGQGGRPRQAARRQVTTRPGPGGGAKTIRPPVRGR